MVQRARVPPGRLHLMRGSCSGSARELDLSWPTQTLAQIERAQAVGGAVVEVREPSVHAHELLALRTLMCAFDSEHAAGQRLAGELEGAVAAGLLGLLEQLHVDLGGEHLVGAAHVARARE